MPPVLTSRNVDSKRDIEVHAMLCSRRDSRQQPKSSAAARLAGVKVITLPREEVRLLGTNSFVMLLTLVILVLGEAERGRKRLETNG